MPKVNKYYNLYKYLSLKELNSLKLTREQIEEILGFALPKSSNIRSWWSNTPENGHVQAHAWVDAGYSVKINENDEVVFTK